jgi:hypothetical protein
MVPACLCPNAIRGGIDLVLQNGERNQPACLPDKRTYIQKKKILLFERPFQKIVAVELGRLPPLKLEGGKGDGIGEIKYRR